jgi:hypothetical protein
MKRGIEDEITQNKTLHKRNINAFRRMVICYLYCLPCINSVEYKRNNESDFRGKRKQVPLF